MEEQRSPQLAKEAWDEQFSRALAEQRQRIERFSQEHETDLARLENQLTTQIDHLGSTIEQDHQQAAEFQRELERHSAELRSQEERLDRWHGELETREAHWQQQREQDDSDEAGRIAELEGKLHDRDTRLAKASEELTEINARVSALSVEIENLQRANADLESQLVTAQDAAQSASAENGDFEELRRVEHELCQQLEAAQAEAETWRHEKETLAAERELLIQRLADAEQASPQATPTGDPEEMAQLKRRLEMAVDDLREMKARNSKLEAELATARQGAMAAAPPGGGSLDWEAQKQRLIAALESDSDDSDPEAQANRLQVEDAIRTTEAVVADKDRQIAELLEQLHDAAGRPEAAAAALVDQDEVVQRERQRLEQLQKEWEEKLRQAEIDLSVERAKIARDRADIEEKLRSLEMKNAEEPPSSASSTGSATPARPARGRWLSRLGLKDEDRT